jgi:hypothetical protein
LFFNSPRRAPSLSRRNPGSYIPLLCPTRPPGASFFWGAGAGCWRWRWQLGGNHSLLTQSLRRLDTENKKQQHNTEPVGWFVACFFKSHAAQQRDWFGQLAISHIGITAGMASKPPGGAGLHGATPPWACKGGGRGLTPALARSTPMTPRRAPPALGSGSLYL